MVIIPGFGAFVSEYRPAEMNEDSDEIKPPSSRLVFNPQIRNNDGLLVGYVAEALRCSHFEALQKIEKERDNILYQLDKGEKVELDELGVFSYNEKNEIEFVSEEDKTLSLESFGLETTSLNENEAGMSEKVEEEPVPETEPVPEEPEAKEETTEEPQEEEPVPTENTVNEEPPVTPQEESPEENREEESEEKEEAAPVASAAAEEPQEEKKKKRGWIWLLVILLPLIAVSVFILMKDRGTNTPVSTPPQTVIEPAEEQPLVVADSTEQDTLQATGQDSSITENVQAEEPKTAETQGPKYYLIGGSFKEKENAETYMETLRAKGLEPFDLGMYGTYYIIGLGTFNSEEEALEAKQEMLDKNPDSGIWVLKR